ncbi:unnamed protein product, partial [Ectocarpus sp. 4 AP-2014]
ADIWGYLTLPQLLTSTLTHSPVLCRTKFATQQIQSLYSINKSTPRQTTMASSSLIVASPAQPRRRNQQLALPTSTTPALHVTRLVEAKTRFCQFCGERHSAW